MNPNRIHRAYSTDGTQVAARVVGQGPPLLLIPAGPGDAETTWGPVLPFLRDRFTCYLANPRGRGLSAAHPDHSPPRQMEDIAALVSGIGAPVCVAEWGSFVGAGWTLFAAREAPGIAAVASYDPLVLGLAAEEDARRLDGVFTQVAEAAGEDRLDDAARTFVAGLAGHGYYTEEDMEGRAPLDFWLSSVERIPMFLRELAQAEEAGGPDPSAPEELAGVDLPVLLLHGARSHPMNIDFVRHLDRHLPNSRVQAVDGAGHYGPHTHPGLVGRTLEAFFQEVGQSS